MQVNEYLIKVRDGRWFVTWDSMRFGPYLHRRAAKEGALAMARSDFSQSIAATVTLDDDGELECIYDSRGQ
ncbi:hypothetical protein [Devosia sediminis]|uniref:DUF2188 domain-containing protein n=1 Tax=Devosia sediminis TaxID=2798801 RepID=A0A934IRT4_9HYPH|nr:hypothetical protein [Devosia sediminis]MBJ3784011.1 hypothetical protein [Devosia sediminis]